MPVRAIIKPAIYSEWRFSCACRAIRFFVDLVDFGEFIVKIPCGIGFRLMKVLPCTLGQKKKKPWFPVTY